jgi:hypothetical protein
MLVEEAIIPPNWFITNLVHPVVRWLVDFLNLSQFKNIVPVIETVGRNILLEYHMEVAGNIIFSQVHLLVVVHAIASSIVHHLIGGTISEILLASILVFYIGNHLRWPFNFITIYVQHQPIDRDVLHTHILHLPERIETSMLIEELSRNRKETHQQCKKYCALSANGATATEARLVVWQSVQMKFYFSSEHISASYKIHFCMGISIIIFKI